MQGILLEMSVNSTNENLDTSKDRLSDTELNYIFCQAVNLSVLYNQLCSRCTNPMLSSKLLYLMPCSLLLFSNSTFNTEKVAEHSERLNKNLLGYSLQLATAEYHCPADSIFQCYSPAERNVGIITFSSKAVVFLGISLGDSGDIKIVQELWDLVVNEWLNNAGRYKHALLSPNKHFDDEVNEFRECGYFSNHMPMVPVSPLLPCTATNAIFLGYSIGQPELYHSVVSLENVFEEIPPHVSSTSMCSNASPKEQVPEHCSCGRGSAKKDGRKFCFQAPNVNKSQCKCYSTTTGCTHRCKCDCGNPYGSSQAAKQAYAHVATSRYRPKQKLQEVKGSTSSLDYLMKQGLAPVFGWSEIDLVLH